MNRDDDFGEKGNRLGEVINQFAIHGDLIGAKPFGSGHINSSFVSEWNQAGVVVRYLHQRINENVFHHPDQVMENIKRVTDHIRAGLLRDGFADASRRTLTIVPSRDGKLLARDADGGYWRTYLFIEGCETGGLAVSAEAARFLGESIARFQGQLADLGGERLHETIPRFHDMENRYAIFRDAVSRDRNGRAGKVKNEIAFMEENEERGGILIRALRSGLIPERICHNDTKMNNILVDKSDSRALCVIDLDTVMPGTSLFDLGDLIRTVTNTAEEDEPDPEKVDFDLGRFGGLLDGYLSRAVDFLVPAELDLLCESGRNITQIMGLRFLTDYLEGDTYYHIDRAKHNLDRCRTQIALIRSMDEKWDAATEIAEKLRGKWNGNRRV